MKKTTIKSISALLFIATTVPTMVLAESLDSYMAKKPDLNGDLIVGEYIKQMAWSIALMEVQQKYGSSSDNKVKFMLDNQGEKYGAISIRKIANDCRTEMQIGISGQLNKKECRLVIASDKK